MDINEGVAVLLSAQLIASSWRIQREVRMEAAGERVGLPWCDRLNLAGLVGTSLVVLLSAHRFVEPVLSLLIGLVIIAVAGYPFVIAGHYELYVRRQPRAQGRCFYPRQEAIALKWVLVTGIAYTLVVLLAGLN